MWRRRFANLLIGMFTLWAIFVVVAWLLGVLIMFPFVEVETDDIPLGRLHAIRLAVICSFAFYGVMHLIQGSAEVFPIHFIKTFLFFLSIIGIAVAWQLQTAGTDVSLQHWALAFFWLGTALLLHFTSPARYRRYFRKR